MRYDLCIESHPLPYRKLCFIVKVPCYRKPDFKNIPLALGTICQQYNIEYLENCNVFDIFYSYKFDLPLDLPLPNNTWQNNGVIYFLFNVRFSVLFSRKPMKFRFPGFQRLNSEFSKSSGFTDIVC